MFSNEYFPTTVRMWCTRGKLFKQENRRGMLCREEEDRLKGGQWRHEQWCIYVKG